MDAFACLNRGHQTVCVLSAAGPERTVSRLRAVLHGAGKVRIRLEDFPAPFYRWNYDPRLCERGYTIHRTRLDYGTWHVLAVAKLDGLLPTMSDELLWQELTSDRYTTPILRAWVPWLREQLLEDGLLRRLDRFQCDAAWLDVSTEALDDYVSEGVKQGFLEVK